MHLIMWSNWTFIYKVLSGCSPFVRCVCVALQLLPADHSRVLLHRSLQQSLQYSPFAHDSVLMALTPPLTFSLSCHELCPLQLFQWDSWGFSWSRSCVRVCQVSALMRRWASVASAAENLMMLRLRLQPYCISQSLTHTHTHWPPSLCYLSLRV